jgi:hypothetical protein
VFSAFLSSHPRFTHVAWLVIDGLAAAYLWAVLFGQGVPGLKSSVQLRGSSSFPDANVAFIAAGLCFGVSPFVVGLIAPVRLRASGRSLGYLELLAVSAAAGAVLFGATQIVLYRQHLALRTGGLSPDLRKAPIAPDERSRRGLTPVREPDLLELPGGVCSDRHKIGMRDRPALMSGSGASRL